MPNTLRIKRRATGGGAGAPSGLANAELAYNEQTNILYYGWGTGGLNGTATQAIPIAGSGYVLDRIAENAPTKSGGGATGTWNISITGNAGSVTNGFYTTGNQVIGEGGNDNTTQIKDRLILGNTIGSVGNGYLIIGGEGGTTAEFSVNNIVLSRNTNINATLSVKGTGVSISGHTHSISDLSTFSSSALAGRISDETGSGSLVFSSGASIVNPSVLGTLNLGDGLNYVPKFTLNSDNGEALSITATKAVYSMPIELSSIGGGTTEPLVLRVQSADFLGTPANLVGIVASGHWRASTILPDKGGTGRSSYSNGQLLIGSGTSLAANTLTPGTGIGITNGSGSITINTNATSSNTASAIVSRDSSGNFSAGTITANLNGNATTVTSGVYTNDSRLTDTRNTTQVLTVNNGGAGDASSFTFNGSTARTISYNSVGAPSISGANATGTWSININGNATTVTNGVYTTGAQTINGAKTFGDTAVFNSGLSVNSQKITNLATPTADSDAATKAYVDASRLGLDVKDSVRVATTANITLSGFQTIDGVSVNGGDRVLVKDQSTGSQNGIYVVSGGAWSRATDADVSAEVTAGMFTFVAEGTVNADSGWVLTTNDTITLGTTALTFAQFSGAGQIIAVSGLAKNGNNLGLATAYGDTINPYGSKNANTVLAAPTGSAGTPSFRALVAGDIPSLGSITNAGAIGSTANLPIITTTNGVLSAGSFGTGVNTFCQGNDSRLSDTRNTTQVLTVNNSGAGDASSFTFNGGTARTISYNSVGAPSIGGVNATGTWNISITGNADTVTNGVYTTRNITASSGLTGGGDLSTDRSLQLGTPSNITLSSTNSVTATSHTHAFAPGGTTSQYIRGDGVATSGGALSKTDDTNVTLTLGGSPTNSLLSAVSLTLGWTGNLAVNRGGTGQTSYVNGELLIGNSTGNTLTKATLTQGTGIAITNGAGSITVAHSDTSPLSAGSVGTSGISSITVDDFGHIQSVTTATYLTQGTLCAALDAANCTIDGGTF